MVQLLSPADYQRMPWANGQGVTRQIWLEVRQFPHDFRWRLSSARVTADAEFSRFPGCDRWLGLSAGHGMLLNGQVLDEIPQRFSGEAPTRAVLTGGPITDVGVIFRRDLIDARMRRLTEVGPAADVGPGGQDLYFGLTGRFSVAGTVCGPDDTLRVRGPHRIEALGPFSCFHFSLRML